MAGSKSSPTRPRNHTAAAWRAVAFPSRNAKPAPPAESAAAFPPEPPTNPINLTEPQRAAKLVRDWHDCTPKQQAWAEKTIAKLAALARKIRENTSD